MLARIAGPQKMPVTIRTTSGTRRKIGPASTIRTSPMATMKTAKSAPAIPLVCPRAAGGKRLRGERPPPAAVLELRAHRHEDVDHRPRRRAPRALRHRRRVDVARRRLRPEVADDDVLAHRHEREVRDQRDA